MPFDSYLVEIPEVLRKRIRNVHISCSEGNQDNKVTEQLMFDLSMLIMDAPKVIAQRRNILDWPKGVISKALEKSTEIEKLKAKNKVLMKTVMDDREFRG